MDLVIRFKIKVCLLDLLLVIIMKEYYCELVLVFKIIINLFLFIGVMLDD